MIHNPTDQAIYDVDYRSLATPGAGDPLSISSKTNAVSELIFVKFLFTTDATVVNRQVRLEIGNGTISTVLSFMPTVQTASLAWQYIFGTNLTPYASGDGLALHAHIPPGLRAYKGWTWGVMIGGICAADQISAVRAYFKLWAYEQ